MLRKIPRMIPNARATSPARENFFNVMVYSCPYSFAVRVSERGGVGFAGADTHGVVEPQYEDFAVADLAGLRRAGDGGDDLVHLIGRHRDLDFYFRQKAHRIFGATIDFGVALLTPVSFDLGDGQSLDSK